MQAGNKVDTLQLKAIGRVCSSLLTTQDAPACGKAGLQEAILEIFPRYCLAMVGVEELPRLLVVYWLHNADREVLRVYPDGDRTRELVGVFANRSPLRPNPIGISVVDVVSVDIDRIRVRGLDAIDGTPIVDLKAP